MNYQELLQNYFIIVDIQRNGKTVYVCKNKQTALYDFFEIKNDLYAKVDKVLEDQLRLIYKSGVPKKIYSINNDKNADKQSGNYELELIKSLIPECKKTINYALHSQTDAIIAICNRKLDKLKFKYNKKEGLTQAFYDPTEHSITVNNISTNKFMFHHMLTHELLHASTKKIMQKTCGTTKINNYVFELANMFTSVVIGSGINEAITDYLAYEYTKKYIFANNLAGDSDADKYLSKPAVSSYDPLVNIFYSLAEKVSMISCLNYYFNCDLDGLVNYINNSYHLKDNDKFLSLIYKMDTYVDILRSAPYEYYLQDLNKVKFEMYKDVVDMCLNKFVAENVDLSTITFDDIIQKYRLPVDEKRFNFYFCEVEDYFNLKVKTKIFADEHYNLNEDAYQISNLLINASYGFAYRLDDKFVNNNFFNKFFSKNLFAYNYKINQNENIIARMQQRAFKNIFNGNRYIADKQKKFDILENLVENNKFLSIDISKFFDDKFICDLVNENPLFLKVLLNEMYVKTVDNFYNMDTNVKLSDQFMSVIKKESLNLRKNNMPYMDLISYYYKSFPINIRAKNKITDELCQFVKEFFGNDRKYKNEIEEFFEEVKEDKNKYNNFESSLNL